MAKLLHIREEFEADYAERSGRPVSQLRRMGFRSIPCDCDEAECRGWQMVTAEAAKCERESGLVVCE